MNIGISIRGSDVDTLEGAVVRMTTTEVDRILPTAYQMSRSCGVSADDPS